MNDRLTNKKFQYLCKKFGKVKVIFVDHCANINNNTICVV